MKIVQIHLQFANDNHFINFINALEQETTLKDSLKDTFKSLNVLKNLITNEKYASLIKQDLFKNLYLIQGELQQKQLLPYEVINLIYLCEFEHLMQNTKKAVTNIKYGKELLLNLTKLIETQKNNNHSIQIFMIRLYYRYILKFAELHLSQDYIQFEDSILNQIQSLPVEYIKQIEEIELVISSSRANDLYLNTQFEQAEQLAKRILVLYQERNDSDIVFLEKISNNTLLSNIQIKKGNLHEEYFEQNERYVEKLQKIYKQNVFPALHLAECAYLCFQRLKVAQWNKIQIKSNYSLADIINIHDQALKEVEKNINIHSEINVHYQRHIELHKSMQTYLKSSI